MSLGFATCPVCFTCYPRLSIHACPGPAEQKHFEPHPANVTFTPGSITVAGAASETRNPKTERIAFLERKKEATKADLLLKFEDGDHHGVADAAMDLRDIESELKGLRF